MSKRGGFPGMGGFGGLNIHELVKEAKKMQADKENSKEEHASKEIEETNSFVSSSEQLSI